MESYRGTRHVDDSIWERYKLRCTRSIQMLGCTMHEIQNAKYMIVPIDLFVEMTWSWKRWTDVTPTLRDVNYGKTDAAS